MRGFRVAVKPIAYHRHLSHRVRKGRITVVQILCLDLEGVLIPELWQELARQSGVEELMLTTRDIPDFGELMAVRLEVMERHSLGFNAIRDAVSASEPLPGAVDFLGWARTEFQVAILSDTFYEIAMPLMPKLGNPFLLCHWLKVRDDKIVHYQLRQPHPKKNAVISFQVLNMKVFAAGDSFNDVEMLQCADCGFFFDAPEIVTERFPEIPAVANFPELRARLEQEIAGVR